MAALIEYECPCCGGRVEFDSSLQQMKCPFCDTVFDVAAMKERDEALHTQQDDMQWADNAGGEWCEDELKGMNSYTCQSCGAAIIADETLGASSCPYCDNPIVMTGKFAGDLRPDFVIPFKLDKNAAKAALSNHLKGKILLPKAFRSENHIDEIKGVYVPFWLFNADSDGTVYFRAQKIRRWEDANFQYKETSYFSLMRGGNMAFERVPVDGSSKMADDLMESIEPFRFNDAVEFQTAYLSGYLAERYDVTAKESEERANERIRKSVESTLRDTIRGYENIETESKSIRLHNGSYKYALYPVWILNTTWNGEKYTFAMNGQTGKFVGNLPVDKAAFWRWFVVLSIICTILAYIIICLFE
jgi:DNA-directed RNA polymerase subunit RPC12/RpoP